VNRHHDFGTDAFSLPAVAAACGPFSTPGFLTSVAPDALLLESEAGLMVVEETPGSVRGAGHRDVVDYRTPLGTDVEGLLSDYAASAPPGTEFMIDSLPLAAAEAVASGLAGAGFAVEMTETESTAVIELPGSFDDYLAGIGKKQRHELRRKRRRYEETVGTVVHEIHDGSGWAFDEFVRLHRLADGDKGGFMVPEMAAFFAALAALDGWRIDVLRVPGTDTAGACLFSFVDGDGFYLYNSSYQPSLSEVSPGMVLLGECIRQAIETSLPRFDFLKGDETYKYRLGAQARALHEVIGRR